MTSKETLTQALEKLPAQLMDQVLDYIPFINSHHFLKLRST